jgi:hypothetical protein
MKKLLMAVVVLGLLGLPMIYSTAKGYTTWFWRNYHAQIFVDGKPVSGYVHQSNQVLIVTWGDLAERRSYWITLTDPATARLCASWSAPSVVIFAVGDVTDPCLINRVTSETPDAPCGPVQIQGNTLELHTTNNKIIKITR